jgi:hypothetical protein
MKHFLLALMLSLLSVAPVFAQQEQPVNEYFITDPITVEVTDKGPGFLKKALKYATLGLIQSNGETVQAMKPFSVLADHNALEAGLEAEGYKLWINGTESRVATVADVWVGNGISGVVTFANVVLPKGTHTIQVSAFNAGGDSPSAGLAVVSSPGKPKAPINVRLMK